MVLFGIAAPAPALASRDDSIEYVRKAEAALANSLPRDARIELLNAIKEDPSYGTPHLLQAKVYLELGDGVAAEAELGRARDAGVPAARIPHLMAHALLLQNAPERALAAADPANVPRAFAAYAGRMRGRALSQLGDPGGAAREFGLAMRLSPRDSEMWVDIGRFRLSTGENAGAVEAADRAVAFGPRNPDALLLKGELARTQYGLVAALPWFERALAIDPHNVPALLAKAGTLGDLGRMRAMLATTRRVLSIEDRNPTAFYLQAVLAARAGKFALSRALMQRTSGALEDQPAAMLLVGAIEYQLGNTEQAIERLARLVSIQPDNIKARRILGAAQWRAGDVRATIETLQPIADLPDADSYVLTLIGRAYERRGERALAANYLDRAAMPSPVLAARPADPREIEVLQRGVAINPGAAAPRVALIRALMRSGRNQEALAQALLLQQGNPGAPAAHVLAGDAFTGLGQYAQAAEAYRRAANISFTEPVAMRLVEALRGAGQGKAAARALSLFLGQNPQSVAGQLLAADFMMSAGEFGRAAIVLEGLRKRLGDRDAALLNNLAWAYFQTGRSAPALALAEKAYALTPANAAVSDTYGWLLYQTRQNRERGLSLLEQAAGQAPRNAGVRWHLAQAYAAEGRKGDAKVAAQAALALPDFGEGPKARALLARL
jgi:tetratricopeptide (TPR) repeat protein